MSKINIFQTLLLAAVLCGCSNNDLDADYGVVGDSSGAITFSTTADWTRSTEIFDNSDIESLEVYSYFSKTAWASAAIGDLSQYFTADIFTPFTLSVDDNGNGTYTGTQYWPSSGMLSFVAFAPNSTSGRNTLSCAADTEGDEATGLPKFTYTMSEQAIDNDDLIFDALYDLTSSSNDSKVAFDLEHILTKLTLEVNLIDSSLDPYDDSSTYEDLSFGGKEDIFVVNGISFQGLYNNATLEIADDGTATWSVEDGTTIELTASQGNTLVPIYNLTEIATGSYDTLINPSAQLKLEEIINYEVVDNYLDVINEGMAIFTLPQDLESKRTSAPTAKVRIRRLFYTEDDIYNNSAYPSGEILYSSAAIEIPASTDLECWEKGQWNNLQFSLDISKLSEYDTPLTLFSQIYEWTETEVDAEVHANTYIYTSASSIELTAEEATADMYVYTNYEYDLRRHKRQIELDGTTTNEAAGFTFYTSTGVRCEPIVMDGTTELYYVYDDDNNLYLSTDPDDYSLGTLIDRDADGHAILTDYIEEMSEDVDNDGSLETLDWITFKIKPVDGNSDYDFTYKVAKLTRDDLGLYTNSSINGDDSSGINKDGSDAVYILRLNINEDHLMNEGGDALATSGDEYGYFSGSIGAELLSNGGGMITYKFSVSLKKALL